MGPRARGCWERGLIYLPILLYHSDVVLLTALGDDNIVYHLLCSLSTGWKEPHHFVLPQHVFSQLMIEHFKKKTINDDSKNIVYPVVFRVHHRALVVGC